MVPALLAAVSVSAQQQTVLVSKAEPTPPSEQGISADKIRIPKGTTIRLVLLKTLSSKTAKEGDTVQLRVLDAVKVDNLVVIANKAPAQATVTAAHPANIAWRPGSLTLRIDYVTLIDQQKLTLLAQKATSGSPTQLELTPVAPLWPVLLPLEALSHGNQGTFAKGFAFSVVTSDEIALDRSLVQSSQPLPVEERRGKTASVTIYMPGKWTSVSVLCGLAKVGRLRDGHKLTFQLPPGKYTFGLGGSGKEARPVSAEADEGDHLYIKADVLPPDWKWNLYLREHDVGEVESEDLVPADAKDSVDVAKLDLTQLHAQPGGAVLDAEITKIGVGFGPQGIAFTPGAAWVACGNSGVARIDEDTNKVEARIPTGRGPAGVAAGEGGIWVVNRDDNTVTRIDPESNRVVATIPVGKKPLGVEAGKGSIWVTNTADGTVSRIDPQTNAVIATIKVGKQTSGVSASTNAVWVAALRGSAMRARAFVTRIDPETNTVAQTVDGPFLNVVLAQGDDVWVSGLYGTVLRVDGKSGSIVAKIIVGNQAEGLSGLAVSHGILWATDYDHAALWRIDLQTNAVVGKVEVGSGPNILGRGVDPGGALWISNAQDGTVMKVEP
jgi:YVTN family beta-propeller protein